MYVAAAGHFKNAEGWAKTNGFEYRRIHNKDEFYEVTPILLGESNNPVLIEVMTDDLRETDAYKRIMQANDLRTGTEKIKSAIVTKANRIMHI